MQIIHSLGSVVSVDFPIMHGLDPFAHITTPSSLRLGSGTMAQWLVVHLCICFHQLLGEGLMIMVVLNLTTGEGQSSAPFHHCLELYLESALCIFGNFPSARFLANPIMVPSTKIFFFPYSPSLSSPQLDLSDPPSSPPHFSFLLPTPLWSSSSHASNLIRRSCDFLRDLTSKV